MGYMHISNAYKFPDIFLLRECFALEKLHGTSAHVSFKLRAADKKEIPLEKGKLHFFGGEVKQATFEALFAPDLLDKFVALGHPEVTVYGEAYGGKIMKMRETYGDRLRFTAFDVQIGDTWLAVPQAEDVCKQLGIEFVHYVKTTTDVPSIDAERDAPSVQAKRCGIAEDRLREGVVLRPLVELTKNNGDRIICKHKRKEFSETATPREINPDELKVIEDAKAISDEWVTEARLEHVLDKLPEAKTVKETGLVVRAMLEDVKREAADEIVWSPDAEKAIGRAASVLYRRKVETVVAGLEPAK